MKGRVQETKKSVYCIYFYVLNFDKKHYKFSMLVVIGYVNSSIDYKKYSDNESLN